MTARGVFSGIRACLKQVYGQADMSGRTIAIQGMGSVGYELGKAVHSAGGQLIVTDIDAPPVSAQRKSSVRRSFLVRPYMSVRPMSAPCALGGA